MCTPARCWLTIFTVEPMPAASPSRHTLPAMASSSAPAASNASGRPEAIIVICPSAAFFGPPGDRAVDQPEPAFGEARLPGRRQGRVDRGRADHHRAAPQMGRQPVGAEQHLLGLRRVDHQHEHGVAVRRERGRRGGGLAAGAGKALAHLVARVATPGRHAAPQRGQRRAETHRAEAHHAQRQHRVIVQIDISGRCPGLPPLFLLKSAPGVTTCWHRRLRPSRLGPVPRFR